MENKHLEEKISYSYISKNDIGDRTPFRWFDTYKEAYESAKFDQPEGRPYFIIERTEHFEICGCVKRRHSKREIDIILNKYNDGELSIGDIIEQCLKINNYDEEKTINDAKFILKNDYCKMTERFIKDKIKYKMQGE